MRETKARPPRSLARDLAGIPGMGLFDEGNLDALARLLIRRWGHEEAFERAKFLAGINRLGARLCRAVEQAILDPSYRPSR